MIISFSISNFRSFSSEETLSLVSNKRLSGKHACHTVPIPNLDEEVLKTAVLYGANGAGKSNLFRGLQYVRGSILNPKKKNTGTGREAFRFDDTYADAPSSFDLQFSTSGKVFRYGFKADDQRVLEEWLVNVNGTKESVIYERVTSDDGAVEIDAPGFGKSSEKLNALATVGGPQNQLFLATIIATLDIEDTSDELISIYNWFDDDLTLISPEASCGVLSQLVADDSEFREFAGAFLNASSTGIEELALSKKEITEDDLRTLLPGGIIPKLLDSIMEDEKQVSKIMLGEGRELHIEKSDKNHFYSTTIQGTHSDGSGNKIPLELSEESDGTKRLLNLIPALHDLKGGSAVYFIDEIDRSMHPILAWKFMEFFLNSCTGDNHQVIVTTHESNLLDLDLLRRDEIWFVEKDTTSSSRLYSLSEFKVRNDLEIRKHYLQGRFGAIPFLGDFNNLLTTIKE